MHKIKNIIRNLVEKMTGRKLIFARDKGRHTAALSKLGFWYAGNVFDTADIAYGISQNGVVEEEETNLVIRIMDFLTSKNALTSFYDIGANTGYYGILAGYRYGASVEVNSFEPIEEHADCIKKSMYLNRLESIMRVHSLALGNENKTEKIYVAGSGTSLNKDFIQGNFESTAQIEVRRLDDIVLGGKEGKSSIRLPDFVKIDVEGYEQQVLEGAMTTLREGLPVLYVEIAKTLKNLGRDGFESSSCLETFGLLSKLGYEPFILKESKIAKFDPANFADGVMMYLFLHAAKHKDIREMLLQ